MEVRCYADPKLFIRMEQSSEQEQRERVRRHWPEGLDSKPVKLIDGASLIASESESPYVVTGHIDPVAECREKGSTSKSRVYHCRRSSRERMPKRDSLIIFGYQ
jgi:hypothetical protein